MATCFCKQPCEKHKFPFATKENWMNRDAYIEKQIEKGFEREKEYEEKDYMFEIPLRYVGDK